MQDAIYTILIVSLPLLGIGLIVGLVVAILQATTQVHEQTLTFVVKIVSVFVSLIIFGPWILTTLQEFFYRMFDYIRLFSGG